MATTDEPGSKRSRRNWAARFGWLLALWLAGVAAIGVAAGLLRLMMRAAGLA